VQRRALGGKKLAGFVRDGDVQITEVHAVDLVIGRSRKETTQ
jgi:hypothetical protein